MITIKKGFTLIELLVVIAIIAILAAILFPVFAQAREKARQTNCLSNMKNLGTAIQLYKDDYNQTFPMGYGTGRIDSNYYWPSKLYPYVKDWKLYYCPSHWVSYDGSIANDEGAWNASSQAMAALSGGYTANPWLLAYMGNATYPSSPIKEARVKSPSNVVALYEGSYWILGDDGWANYGWYSAWLPGSGAAGHPTSASLSGDALSEYNNGRHNEGINFAFADGHAGFYKTAEALTWMNTTSKNPMRPATW
jgi:prepilin-type N-terminal cleavage/methylation domain-containing protein/prepilin-type processing-associated H-X9-DG protein